MSRGRMRTLLLAGAAASLATGCLPQPVTSQGQSTYSLYTVLVAMSAVVAALVWGLTTWAIVRYRRGRRATTDLPPQTRGSLVLETIWTAGPLLAVVVIFVLTLLTLNVVNAAPSESSSAVRLDVQAFRWGWQMTYPDEGVTVEGVRAPGPEAVLPVGREIDITVTSVDVIHSFFVPQFLYKRDAIPGHPNSFTVNIQQQGTFAGECAEFCGIYHSQMPFTIRAVTGTDYQAWLAQQRAGSVASPGATP
jgi:cytochrome c oxidase subunit 2